MLANVPLVPGFAVGAFSAITASAENTVTAGIIIFAVGIILGAVCVSYVGRLVHRRLQMNYDEWTRAGQPERRWGDRRAAP